MSVMIEWISSGVLFALVVTVVRKWRSREVFKSPYERILFTIINNRQS
jgi:hypothetical protein